MPDSYRELQSMEMEKRMDEEFELDERKTKILDAIIRNYLETGEPVGSRTISKYTDLNLSSATIRNEMSDLELLGYLERKNLDTFYSRILQPAGFLLTKDTAFMWII